MPGLFKIANTVCRRNEKDKKKKTERRKEEARERNREKEKRGKEGGRHHIKINVLFKINFLFS